MWNWVHEISEQWEECLLVGEWVAVSEGLNLGGTSQVLSQTAFKAQKISRLFLSGEVSIDTVLETNTTRPLEPAQSQQESSEMSSPVTVSIIDDHALLREGMCALFERDERFTIAGQGGSIEEGLALMEGSPPQLLLVDLVLPDGNGLILVKKVAKEWPDTKVLVVSAHEDDIYAERALRAGARGYLCKSSPTADFIKAATTVLDGKVHASPEVTDAILMRVTRSNPKKTDAADSVVKVLSDRELEVFEMIGKGFRNQEIAEALTISARTVDAHKARIKDKLDIAEGNRLTAFAVRWASSGQ